MAADNIMMDYDQPAPKLFGLIPKKMAMRGLAALVGLGVLLAILAVSGVISFGDFKTVGYKSSKGAEYKLAFYKKHSSKQLKSGNPQLVSQVSREDKFPLTFSANKGASSGYDDLKDCSAFTTALDVQNDNVDQKIAVCDVSSDALIGGQSVSDIVYMAGFTYKGQIHVITISQDYGSLNLSNKSDAKAALSKFGMKPYQTDIEKIVSSIKVQ